MKQLRQPYFIYLLCISSLGVLLVLWSLIQFPDYEPKLNYLLLLSMAVIAQLTTTSVAVTNKAGITFEVGTAVSMAALPVYGLEGAVLIVAVSSLGIWLIKPVNNNTWKRNWQQLGFNTGMWTIAVFVAGHIFLAASSWLGSDTLWGRTLPWLFAAIVDDQINFWLLMIMLRLQHRQELSLLGIWQENRWASSINILIMSFGGGFLAYAVEQYDWIGIVIFFLPIILSTYAFRLYVGQMQSYLDSLEEIVEERTREIAGLMEDKDAFLAVLSHDMNTPLASLEMFLELLEAQPTIVQDEPELFEAMRNSQRTLLSLVANILDLEKMRAGAPLLLYKDTLDLTQVIETTIEMMKPQAEKKQITLYSQFDAQPLPVFADSQQIERVLLNLISNALKYTRTTGTACVRAYKANNFTVIDVQDNGFGIPSEELPFVFDRFSRVNKHKKLTAGTGLGLAIAKAIVEAHEGEITVSSQENLGSTFTVRLPALESL